MFDSREVLEKEIRLKGEEAFLRSLQLSVQSLKLEIYKNSQTQIEIAQMQQEMKDFSKELVYMLLFYEKSFVINRSVDFLLSYILQL